MPLHIGDATAEKSLKNNEKSMVWYCHISCASMLVLYMQFLLHTGNTTLQACFSIAC